MLLGEVENAVKSLLLETAAEKGINLLECKPMVDHVHMLVEAGSPEELAWTLKLLKGRSSYELCRRIPELKIDTGETSLWQRGFAARQVPVDQIDRVRWYIRTQDKRLEKYER